MEPETYQAVFTLLFMKHNPYVVIHLLPLIGVNIFITVTTQHWQHFIQKANRVIAAPYDSYTPVLIEYCRNIPQQDRQTLNLQRHLNAIVALAAITHLRNPHLNMVRFL
jgi:uncharacterized protein (DUF486 family)